MVTNIWKFWHKMYYNYALIYDNPSGVFVVGQSNGFCGNFCQIDSSC